MDEYASNDSEYERAGVSENPFKKSWVLLDGLPNFILCVPDS